jgi:hypothetical protein
MMTVDRWPCLCPGLIEHPLAASQPGQQVVPATLRLGVDQLVYRGECVVGLNALSPLDCGATQMRWQIIEYPDDGECSICQRATADLCEPVDCSDAEEALIWATVCPAGPVGVACCPLCIEHGIFNRLVSIAMTQPIVDFLTETRVPFRVVDTERVEFYPRREAAFLEKLATFIKGQPS